MSLKEGQVIDRDNLNRAYVSKSATGTQVMAGSLNLLGALTVGSLTTGAVTINGAVALGSNNLTTTGTITAGTFSGSGANLTNLNASNLSSGTVADARLSSNVMLLNNTQTITGTKIHATEQQFHRGTWTDPHRDTPYAIKWAQGAAGDTLRLTGNATILGSVTTTALYLNASGGEGSIYGVDTIEGFNDIRFSIQGQGIKHYMNATGLQLGGGNTPPNATLDIRGDAIITGSLDVQTEAKFSAYNEFPDPLLAAGLTSLWTSFKASTATVTYDAAQKPAQTGASGSIKVEATGDDAWVYYNYTFDVAPNEWITFSAYMFCTTSGKNMELLIQWLDASGATISHSHTRYTAPTSWERFKLTAQAPANAVKFRVRIDNDGGAGTIMYFSAFQVERGRTMTGFSPYSGGKDIAIAYNGTEGLIKSNKLLINNTTTQFTGSVGIGVDPSYPLHIKTSNTGTALYVENGSMNGTIAEFKAAGDNTILTVQSDHVYSSANLHLGVEATPTYIRGTKIGIRTTSPHVDADIDLSGKVKLGNFSTSTNDEWPIVYWLRDLANEWDEGIIKGGTSRHVNSKAGFGIHFHSSRAFSFFSTGWTRNWTIEHGGHVNQAGNLTVGGNITTSGNITTGGAGDHPRLRIGNVTFSTVTGNDLVIRNMSQLRFSDSGAFDWNSWAGILYQNSTKRLVIGGPASGFFAANASPPTVEVIFDGVSKVTVNGTLEMGANRNINQVGGSIFQNAPDTTGGWARGIFWKEKTQTTNIGGVGIYGTNTTVNWIYLGHGTAPWADNKGIVILPDGKVGVGTSSPFVALDVAGDIRIPNGSSLWVNGYRDTDPQRFRFHHSGGNSYIDYAGGRLAFRTGTTDKITFDSAGKIGVGITSPTELLHIKSGSILIDGGRLKLGQGDGGTDWSIYAEGESLSIRESDDSDKEYLRIDDEASITLKPSGVTALTLNANKSIVAEGDTTIKGNIYGLQNIFLDDANGSPTYREKGYVGIASRLNGRLLNRNPDFISGDMTGYITYDNNGSGRIVRTIVNDDTVPNATGKIMRISYDPTRNPSTATTPGYGGFCIGFGKDSSGNLSGWNYKQGNRYIHRIIAKIPAGRNIAFGTNGYGTGGSHRWLTSTAGTGNWEEYVAIQNIGVGGTLSSTGYWYIEGGSDTSFDWDVALVQIIGIDEIPDVDRSPSLNVGYKQTNVGWGEIYATGKITTDSDLKASGILQIDGISNSYIRGNLSVGSNAVPSYTLDVTGTIRSTGNLYVSTGNATGGGIWLADDGSIVDLQDGFATMRFSRGVRITNARDGGATVIQLGNGVSGGGEHIYFNTSGNFGIGTASPSKKFHVNGGESYFQSGSGTGIIQIHGTGDGYSNGTMLWIRNDSVDTANKYIRLEADTNGTPVEFLNIRYGGSNIATIANPSGGGIDITARVSAASFKVASGFTDLVNNAPWYGLGYTNVTAGSGHYTQLAGYWGLLLKTSDNEIRITQTANDVQINGNRILTTADQGSGKGMDADTVDGKHKTDFMSSTVYHEFYTVPPGGIAAGTAITIPNGRSYENDKLIVFRDRLVQYPNDDYVRTSPTQVTFNYNLPEGSKLYFIINMKG